MLEYYSDRLETIKLINISYVKNSYGENVESESYETIEAVINNGTAKVSTTSNSVEFIDYLKVLYEDGELKKGDKVEIRGSEYRVASEPKSYSSHMKAEVVKIV